MRDLEGAQQPLGEKLMRFEPGDILAIHDDATGSRLKNACDHIEKCRFSSAIRTDKPGDRAGFDPDGRPVDRAKAAEMFMKVLDLDHLIGSPCCDAARHIQAPGCNTFSAMV